MKLPLSAGGTDFRIYEADCLEGVPKYVSPGLPTLLCCDPPWNIGQPYSNYNDRKKQDEYIEYIGTRIGKAGEYLHPHATIWLAINNLNVSELDIYCKKTLKLFPRSQVRWHFSFGQNNPKNFTNSHITWLVYTKHKTKFTFNAKAALVPSARQLIYKDKRAKAGGRLPNDIWVLLPQFEPQAFKPLDDAWFFSKICGTFHEKFEQSPNQMPVVMLQRIIGACSNPGDTVLDIFGGSFSCGEAAILEGRQFIGMDVSNDCVQHGSVRLHKAVAEMDAKANHKGKHAQLDLFPESKTK